MKENDSINGDERAIPDFSKHISLVAYHPVTVGYEATKDFFDNVKDSKCNTIIWPTMHHSDVADLSNIFAYSKQCSLNVVVYTDRVYLYGDPAAGTATQAEFNSDINKLTTNVNSIISHSNLVGWMIANEPYYYNWHSPIPRGSVNLPKTTEYVSRFAPGKLVYSNLAATVNSTFIGNNSTYYSYLEEYNRKFYPQLWSFNYWTISQIIGIPLKDSVRTAYFSFLEDYFKISKATGKPFWTYCMVTPHTVFKKSDNADIKSHVTIIYPPYSETQIRMLVLSALAYGAKGIVYWAFAQMGDTYNKDQRFCSVKYVTAPVDRTKNKTKIFRSIKAVNTDVQSYNRIFSKCLVKKAGHLGTIPSGCTKWPDNLGIVTQIYLKIVRDGNIAGVIVSAFEPYDANRDNVDKYNSASTTNKTYYLLIVNKDTQNNQDITIKLTGVENWEVHTVTDNIQGAAIGSEDNEPKRDSRKILGLRGTMSPGDFMIVSFNPKTSTTGSPFD